MVLNRRMLRAMTVVIVVLVGIVSLSGLLAGETPECTITVQPGESIQAAIDRAPEGAVICLPAGMWEESIKVERSITLRGSGAEETIIDGVRAGYPVVWIVGPKERRTILVQVEGLMLREATGLCADRDRGIRAYGVLIQGAAQVMITGSTISGNSWDGIWLGGTAQVVITDSTISGNRSDGIELRGSAQAVITGSTISGNMRNGIDLRNTAQAVISDSMISGNRQNGIELQGSAQAEITASTISDNGGDGIHLRNATTLNLVDSRILRNRRYGVSAHLPDCVCAEDYRARWKFTGQVTGSGNRIPGRGGSDRNRKGAVCPPEFAFLMR